MSMSKHGIILGGWKIDESEAFHSRSPGSYKIAHHCRSLGWDIEVIDYITYWNPPKLKKYIKHIILQENTKWIGISYNWLFSYANEIYELVTEFKNTFPNIKILVGGQGPFNNDLNADWYIFGYGEEAITKVLEYEFSNGTKPISVPKFGGNYINAVKNYPSNLLKDYRITYLENDYLDSNDVVSIELSRGCKFKCNYCNYPFIGIKDDTSRSEEDIYQELVENYERWGITQYIIADDTYNDRIEKMIKLQNAVSRLDFEPNFSCFIRADLLATNSDMKKVLSNSRVWGHYYGVETFNRTAGRSIGKGMDPNRVKDALLEVREYLLNDIGAYRGSIGLIAGLPGEDIQSLEQTDEWINKYWNTESRLWWPLQITNDQDSLSAFGQNLEKYGYRKMKSNDRILGMEHKNSYNQIIWENDITNMYEMVEFCGPRMMKPDGIDGFAVAGYTPFLGIEDTLNIKQQPSERYGYPAYAIKSQEKIKKYILSKLKGRNIR